MKRFLDLKISEIYSLTQKWDITDYANCYINEYNVPLKKTDKGYIGFPLLEQDFHNRIQRKNLLDK